MATKKEAPKQPINSKNGQIKSNHRSNRVKWLAINAWGIVKAVIFSFVAMIGYSVMVLIARFAIHDGWRVGKQFHHPFLVSSIYGLVVASVVWFLVWYITRRYDHPKAKLNQTKDNIKSLKFWIETSFWYLLMIGLRTGAYILFPLKNGTTNNQDKLMALYQANSWQKVYLLVYTVLIAVIVEEFIYRWAIFKLVPSTTMATITSVALFTAIHTPKTLGGVVTYGIMAVILCVIYQKWGLSGSVAEHGLSNLIAAMAMLK